jgi:phospholipid/cholesterol/gamma-HCH transport system substrate-binding protein
MEREANYTAVGAFVLLVLIMAGLFVYWYSDSRDRRDYVRYELYFSGSVSGLQRGAAVRYLGVDVGRVAQLRIDRRSSGRVQVIADIDSEAPVSERTLAELSLQGVTGLLYIDLIEDKGTKPLDEAVESERYPVIRSTRSNFDIFLAGLPDMVGKASLTLDRVNQVLSEENVASLTRTVANLEAAVAGLPDTIRGADALVADLRNTSQEITAAAASVRSITAGAGPDVAATLERVRAAAESLAATTARLDRFVVQNEGEVTDFAQGTLGELDGLVRESRATAAELRDLSRALREQPSQVLYQPRHHGVEIPP